MKPRTLCCYALPIKLTKEKPYKYECANCGLVTERVGNKKLYLHVQRQIRNWMSKAPKNSSDFVDYVETTLTTQTPPNS